MDRDHQVSESEQHTQDWMNELRSNAQTADEEAADRANCARGVHRLVNAPDEPDQCEVCPYVASGAETAAARLRPEHTLAWACAKVVRMMRECSVDTFTDEAELIAHVRNVVALSDDEWAPGATIFQDHGDDNSLAYFVVLSATPTEIAQLVQS